MEYKKEEALRAKNFAKSMMQDNDFVSARQLLIRAQKLCDDSEISKMLIVSDVHCLAAEKLVGGEINWYEIIQVQQTADEVEITKQYRKFALQLRSDKNQFPGAEAAFKLISEARRVLLDKEKRNLFDKKYKYSSVKPATKLKEDVKEEDAANVNIERISSFYLRNLAMQQKPKVLSTPSSVSLTFWTICPFCRIKFKYYKAVMNKAIRCQNCSKGFYAYDRDNASSHSSKMKQKVFPKEPSVCRKGLDYNGGFSAGQSKEDIIEKTVPANEAGSKNSSGERRKEVPDSSKSSDTEIDTNARNNAVVNENENFDTGKNLVSAFQPSGESVLMDKTVPASEAGPKKSSDERNKVISESSGSSVAEIDTDTRKNGVINEENFFDVGVNSGKAFKPSGEAQSVLFDKTFTASEAGWKRSSGETKKEIPEPIESSTSSDAEIDTNTADLLIHDQGYLQFLNKQEANGEAESVKCISSLNRPAMSCGGRGSYPSARGDSNLHNESNFVNVSPKQTVQPELSHGSLTFLTVCPCCAVKTECHKSIMQRALRCQNCNKSFIAYDCGRCKRKKKDNEDRYFETGQNSQIKHSRRSGRLNKRSSYGKNLDDDVDMGVMISDYDEKDLAFAHIEDGSCKAPNVDVHALPQPDFNDFDKKREGESFAANQIWALYDTLDAMPRFYALIKEVIFLPRLNVQVTWLEAEAEDESETKWVDEGLPVGCGKFKVYDHEDNEDTSMFSHLVSCQIASTGKEDTCNILPIKGEIWALFKNWNINWKTDTNPYHRYEYEFVEILSEHDDSHSGTSVAYLSKVKGFVSVFRPTDSAFHIPPTQRFRFSHRVPSFKLTGDESEGVLRGSFELDPAALPASMEYGHPYEDLASRPKNHCYFVTTITCSSQQSYLVISRSCILSGAALPTTIFLRLSTGLMWQIKLSEEGENVCFTEGWQAFAKFSSLKVGHVVVFEHSESNVFNVCVKVNKNGEEIEYPLDDVVDVEPQDTLSGDIEFSRKRKREKCIQQLCCKRILRQRATRR